MPRRLAKTGSTNAGKPIAAHYGLPDEQLHPAICAAWREGKVREIPGKLELTQVGMLEQLESLPPNKWRMVLASRKIGKTWLACVLMLEHCLTDPSANVVYLGPVGKTGKAAIIDIMEELLVNCPLSCSPAWMTADQLFRFQNGAQIRVIGTNNNRAKTQRGPRATMLVVDECSFIDNLESIVKSVLGPMTLRSPNARKLMLTSAPEESGHAVLEFIADHRAKGTMVERTIYDRKGGTPAEQARIDAELAEAIEACGGADTSHFRREYCNELIFDTDQTVIPEWQDAARVLGKNAVHGKPDGTGLIRDVPMPESFVALVGWDPGFHHHSGVTFGYVDFEKQWLVFVDELDVRRMISSDLAPLIRAKEKELWGKDHRPVRIQRIMDNAPDAQGQMHKEGLLFAGIGKKDLKANVNLFRRLVKQEKLIVSPRCKTLIACLYKAGWRARHSEDSELRFKEDGKLGHFDVLASAIYMAARAPWDENPFPELAKEWSPYTQQQEATLAAYNTRTGRHQKLSAQVKRLADSFADNLK
jgi:hypothetical protein